jgi:acetyl esterase/lipase
MMRKTRETIHSLISAPNIAKYGAPPYDPRLSPLLFESHAHFAPPAVFHVCGRDPRRGEALLFEELLRQAGTQTNKFIYAGLSHGFWTSYSDLEVSQKWLLGLIQGVRFLLHG